MSPNKRLHSLMDSTTGVLCCLAIFVVRATITAWPTSGLFTHTYCVLAGVACVAGITANTTSCKLISTRSSE